MVDAALLGDETCQVQLHDNGVEKRRSASDSSASDAVTSAHALVSRGSIDGNNHIRASRRLPRMSTIPRACRCIASSESDKRILSSVFLIASPRFLSREVFKLETNPVLSLSLSFSAKLQFQKFAILPCEMFVELWKIGNFATSCKFRSEFPLTKN